MLVKNSIYISTSGVLRYIRLLNTKMVKQFKRESSKRRGVLSEERKMSGPHRPQFPMQWLYQCGKRELSSQSYKSCINVFYHRLFSLPCIFIPLQYQPYHDHNKKSKQLIWFVNVWGAVIIVFQCIEIANSLFRMSI